MKRKGFTLIELLVVIAIIALLLGILMPALAMIRAKALQLLCGTNLGGIGKAMVLYSSDNEDRFPIAGHSIPFGHKPYWFGSGVNPRIPLWSAATIDAAYIGQEDNKLTVSSSFFLLVRYADTTPSQFKCRGDVQSKIWS